MADTKLKEAIAEWEKSSADLASKREASENLRRHHEAIRRAMGCDDDNGLWGRVILTIVALEFGLALILAVFAPKALL